jgi:hypothetical protein
MADGDGQTTISNGLPRLGEISRAVTRHPQPRRGRRCPELRRQSGRGGLPGIGALAPDGDYDDLGFMRQLLSEVKQRGGTGVLGRSWLALRGETPGAAARKADVDDLAGRAEWFDRVSRQALGRSLPILATLDPAGRPEQLTANPAATSASAPVEQTERALRALRRKLPALFAASRGTIEARRA